MIDFHTHCFPDRIAGRAMDVLSSEADVTATTDGTVGDLLSHLDAAGMDRAVVLNITTNVKQQRNVNDFAREINGDRLIAFGSVNPHSETALEELEYIKAAGLSGVKFHPEYQEFDVADRQYYPIYEACYELGLIMSFHAGKDIAFPNTNMVHPKALRALCDHLPNAKIVAAHMGGWMQWQEVATYLIGSSCYFDTSFTEGYLDKNSLVDMIINHGVGKVLFGTDCPWADLQESIGYIDSLPLAAIDKKQIFEQNAQELLSK